MGMENSNKCCGESLRTRKHENKGWRTYIKVQWFDIFSFLFKIKFEKVSSMKVYKNKLKLD